MQNGIIGRCLRDTLAPALIAAVALLGAGPAAAEIWFEDNFDGGALGQDWELRNVNEDSYAVDGGVLTFLVPDRTVPNPDTSPNVLVLNRPLPEGDWTLTVHYTLTPQTMAEELWIGTARDGDNAIYAISYLWTDNYVTTFEAVQTRKTRKGEVAKFSRNLYSIEAENLEARGAAWTENIAAVELRLSRRGREYEGAVRLIPAAGAPNPPTGEWNPTRPVTSLKPLGDHFVLFFGSSGSSYIPEGGEALIDIDWVRVETP